MIRDYQWEEPDPLVFVFLLHEEARLRGGRKHYHTTFVHGGAGSGVNA